MILEIVLVNADDWEGLYINGELVSEDHSINASHLLHKISGYKNIDSIKGESKYVDEEWFEREVCDGSGRLPEKLSEVEFEKED